MASELNFTSTDKKFWKTLYGKPQEMDGVFNSKEHCKYLDAIFKLEIVDISTIVEFGCGYGYILRDLIKTFKPQLIEVVEPSPLAIESAKKRIGTIKHTKVVFYHQTIQEWCKNKTTKKPRVKDLAVCNSVLQYVPTKDLEKVMEVLAKYFRYLYLTVPTNKEYKIQQTDEKFLDPYAISRSKMFYRSLIKKHFTIVSSRLLESKVHFDETCTSFTELLFRD